MNDENDELPELRFRDMPERTPRVVERLALGVHPESSLDEVMVALDAAEWLQSRARFIVALAKRATVEWIEENGEFTVGPLRYSVGYTMNTKCVDVPRCGMVLLDALGGDFEAFLRVLGSNAYKYGAAKSILDRQVYGSLFHVTNASRLVNGVPERTLQRSDPTYSIRKTASRENK